MSYKVVSAVVKFCPRLLYSKTDSKCLLPRLVDWLVLPLTSSKKPPVQGMSLCIRTHLQHFLSGLLQLEPSRDDFIRRKVKQIFSKYFHSYAQPKNPLMLQNIPNPFMVLLQPCFALQVTEETRYVKSTQASCMQYFLHHCGPHVYALLCIYIHTREASSYFSFWR